LKRDDPSLPTITYQIGPQIFNNAFCDLGSGVNIISKVTYDNLLGGPLDPTFVRLQMVDQTIRFPEGLARDILIKIKNTYVVVDFIMLDMGSNTNVPIILGRPFLSMVDTTIYMGAAQIHMQFDSEWRVRVPFNGFKVNMQDEEKALQPKPHHNHHRWKNHRKSASAKKAEAKEEEPAKTPIEVKQEWRAKEVQSQSPSLGLTYVSIE